MAKTMKRSSTRRPSWRSSRRIWNINRTNCTVHCRRSVSLAKSKTSHLRAKRRLRWSDVGNLFLGPCKRLFRHVTATSISAATRETRQTSCSISVTGDKAKAAYSTLGVMGPVWRVRCWRGEGVLLPMVEDNHSLVANDWKWLKI